MRFLNFIYFLIRGFVLICFFLLTIQYTYVLFLSLNHLPSSSNFILSVFYLIIISNIFFRIKSRLLFLLFIFSVLIPFTFLTCTVSFTILLLRLLAILLLIAIIPYLLFLVIPGKFSDTFTLKVRVYYVVSFIILFVFLIIIFNSYTRYLPWQFTFGEPIISGNVDQLEETEYITSIDQAHIPRKNIIWCPALEIAIKNKIIPKIENDNHCVIGAPNFYDERFDLDTIFYFEGTKDNRATDDFLKSVKYCVSAIEYKSFSKLLSDIPKNEKTVLSYLSINLPFRYAFERFDKSLSFNNIKVESFGIMNYTEKSVDKVKSGSQICVYDFINEDDFIVRLGSRKRGHNIFLAKVKPESNFEETIKRIFKRIDSNTLEKMQKFKDFIVPIIDFDLVYSLYKNSKLSKNSEKINFIQKIRFQFDDRGALLMRSEIKSKGKAKSLIFDKPFMILLNYRNSNIPYFALWIANTELLLKENVSQR